MVGKRGHDFGRFPAASRAVSEIRSQRGGNSSQHAGRDPPHISLETQGRLRLTGRVNFDAIHEKSIVRELTQTAGPVDR